MKGVAILLVFSLLSIALAQNSRWTVYNTSNSGLPSNWVSAIAIDNEGNKWIGIGSLVKFDGVNWTVYNTSNSGLPFDNVLAIAIDNAGNKWIGTSGGGLVKFDGVNWTVYNTSNSGLPSNYVFEIAIDNEGNKWIGTPDGLVKFEGLNWTVYNTSNSGLPDNHVLAITIDNVGNKWIGTGEGLAKFDGVNWTVYNTSNSGLPNNYVWAIAIDNTGNKWIGTNGGLAKFDGVNWTVYNTSNSGLPYNHVNAIAIDNEGNIWIGTGGQYGGGGLARFDGVRWTVYNSSNSSLPFDYVMAIAIDNAGNKWIGTSRGLAKLGGISYRNVVLFYRNNNLWIMDNDGRNQKQITKGGCDTWTLQISKDRSKISFFSGNHFYVVSSKGEVLYNLNLPKIPLIGTFDAKMSPDGGKVALVKAEEKLNEMEARRFNNKEIRNGSPKNTGIYIYDIKTKSLKKLVGKLPNNLRSKEHYNETEWMDFHLFWSPDGDKLHFERDYMIYAEKETYGDSYLVDVNNGQLEYLGTSGGRINNWINDQIIYSAEGIVSVFDISRRRFNENFKKLSQKFSLIFYLSSSYDRCLFSAVDDNGNSVLLLYDTRTDELKSLTQGKGDIKACFSPDGNRILYSDDNGLKILDVDRFGKILSISSLPINNPKSVNSFFWNVDNRIIFNMYTEGGKSIWSANPDGTDLKKIANNAEFIDWVQIPGRLVNK